MKSYALYSEKSTNPLHVQNSNICIHLRWQKKKKCDFSHCILSLPETLARFLYPYQQIHPTEESSFTGQFQWCLATNSDSWQTNTCIKNCTCIIDAFIYSVTTSTGNFCLRSTKLLSQSLLTGCIFNIACWGSTNTNRIVWFIKHWGTHRCCSWRCQQFYCYPH